MIASNVHPDSFVAYIGLLQHTMIRLPFFFVLTRSQVVTILCIGQIAGRNDGRWPDSVQRARDEFAQITFTAFISVDADMQIGDLQI